MASGLGAREFAAQEQCNPKTLDMWRWRLGLGPRAKAAAVVTRVGSAKPARFIEVQPMNMIEATSSSANARRIASQPFEVTLPSGARLVVPAQFERQSLQSLVELLGGR